MRRWKRFRAVAGGLLLAVCVSGIRADATETGTITGLSEKVYKTMDTNGEVIANLIAQTRVLILEAESDAAGSVWYRIETDMGTEGYIPAQSVAVAGRDTTEHEEAESGGNDENGNAAGVDAPDEGRLGGNGADQAGRQIRTTGVVNVRDAASTGAAVVGEIPQDTTLSYSSVQENQIGELWYEVTYGEIHGYIRESTVSLLAETGQEEEEGEAAGGVDAQTEETGVFPDVQPGQPFLPQEPANDAEDAEPEAMAGPEEDAPQSGQSAEEGRGGEESWDKTDILDGEEDGKTEPASEADAGETNDKKEAEGTETVPRKGKLLIDWIVVAAFAGSLLCLAVIYCMAKKIARLYGRKR